MQFSSQDLVFNYQQNKHLMTTLTLKNIQNFNQVFKFKISTSNKFRLKPNIGSIQPGQSVAVEIVIHKDIVQNYENERIQIVYGRSWEDNKSIKSAMFRIIIDGLTSNLNLTTMVESKHQRIKQLQSQVQDLKMMPNTKTGAKKGKSNKFILKLVLAIIIGLLIGFFGPIKIFKKKIILRKV